MVFSRASSSLNLEDVLVHLLEPTPQARSYQMVGAASVEATTSVIAATMTGDVCEAERA
jgi:hypothetical protein